MNRENGQQQLGTAASALRGIAIAAVLGTGGCSALSVPTAQSIQGLTPSGTVTLHEEFVAGYGGVKVVNVFAGPLETEWYQTVQPPKVAPASLARATVDALRNGLEDVFVGDVAEDLRARLAVNPKAVERELGS